MTPDGRYGPYGLGELSAGYNRSRVDWDAVDWGALQDLCYERNLDRFPVDANRTMVRDDRRFSLKESPGAMQSVPPVRSKSGRTAVVVRGFSSFRFKAEDLWHLRALITETALDSGADYTVYLLVHIQDRDKNLFGSEEAYREALDSANIPLEFRSMTVLWSDSLLESWYDNIQDHQTNMQVFQPMQLFARLHPEFDHYWQLEMDQRFLGHAGKYVDAVTDFARREPRKQALERSTFPFQENEYGTYEQLRRRVDRANRGKSRAWGPMRIPDVEPVGPAPPTDDASDDAFAWGVGEEADVIVSSFCGDVLPSVWLFRDYIDGFRMGRDTPRYWCQPAVMRGSRLLLDRVHDAQAGRGLVIPSEATLPSHALWHGLKLSYPPQPVHLRPAESDERPQWLGRVPETAPDGLSHNDPMSLADNGLTWWFLSTFTRTIMDAWLSGDAASEEVAGVLASHNGELLIPNFAMHPVKS